MVIAVVGVLGAVILGVNFLTHIDVELLISDPAEKGHLPAYTGMYTYAGSFALLVAGAVCVFTAVVLRGRPGAWPGESFLLLLGALVAWLGIDDLFMFHEWSGLAIAELAGRGDEPGARSRLESIVFVAYAVIWFLWIARYWRVIRDTAYVLLGLTLGFLAASVAIDIGLYLFPEVLPDTAWMPTTIAVAEEMLKLTGAFLAFAYVWETCVGAVRWVIEAKATS